LYAINIPAASVENFLCDLGLARQPRGENTARLAKDRSVGLFVSVGLFGLPGGLHGNEVRGGLACPGWCICLTRHVHSGSLLVGRGDSDLLLLPQMANRHGLIAGATGTGKTVTLQVLAENFSARGVPVFMADVKGDLSGISQPGSPLPAIMERASRLSLEPFQFAGCPVTFWDVYGEQGHPARTTISEMGPLLLSRLLQLNETQAGVLSIAFRVADQHGLLLLDLKDLRALLGYLAENAAVISTQHGNVSSASVGAIQRGLTVLEEQGAAQLFGEPSLNLDDLLQTDSHGAGIVNILAADRLILAPRLYAAFLLWVLSELFENLPEVGDQPRPRLVFFFDEAHLLFQDAPRVLVEKIEQVVRLIRSKGVGIYLVTQHPQDIPDTVLGQLGNRVQHALRAFTARDQKAVRAAAQTFRSNPALDTERILTELGVGEALVSLLDEKGQPAVVQRTLICPPRSQIGPLTPDQRREIRGHSLVAGIYEQSIDRESAYELLARARGLAAPEATSLPQAGPGERGGRSEQSKPEPLPPPKSVPGQTGRGRTPDTFLEVMAKSTMRTVGSTIGREIVRGVLGSIFGRRRR
jgi:DNA helicase HerA-like ATPase